MKLKKLSALLIATLVLFGATSACSADYKTKLTLTIANGSSSAYDEVYTLEVPADFTITKSGWNSLGSITAKYSGTKTGFNPSKKLVVTATSANSFKLTADGVSDTISYFLATGENDTSATTTFQFFAEDITTEGTSKAVGVSVEDFSNKADGTYTDEITYTAEVQNDTLTLAHALRTGSTLTISFKSGSDSSSLRDSSATFTRQSDGSYTETHSGWFLQGGARMSVQNGSLVAEFSALSLDSGHDIWSDPGLINTLTLNPNNNTWTISKGANTVGNAYETSEYKFAVNGTDITDQLTQQ